MRTIRSSPISERPSSASRWPRIGVDIASRMAGARPQLHQRAADPAPIGERGLDQRLHQEEADHRPLPVRPRRRSPRRRPRCGGPPRFRTARSMSSGCARKSIASGRGQMLFRSSFQNRYLSPFGIDEDVGVDHAAAHLRLAGIEAEAGGVERLAGDQRRAIVDPRPQRARAPGEADGERVRRLPGGEGEPIFIAHPGHLRRPEIGDVAALRRPDGLIPMRERRSLWAPNARGRVEWRIGKASGASFDVATSQ